MEDGLSRFFRLRRPSFFPPRRGSPAKSRLISSYYRNGLSWLMRDSTASQRPLPAGQPLSAEAAFYLRVVVRAANNTHASVSATPQAAVTKYIRILWCSLNSSCAASSVPYVNMTAKTAPTNPTTLGSHFFIECSYTSIAALSISAAPTSSKRARSIGGAPPPSAFFTVLPPRSKWYRWGAFDARRRIARHDDRASRVFGFGPLAVKAFFAWPAFVASPPLSVRWSDV
jgi:hypothetical protein